MSVDNKNTQPDAEKPGNNEFKGHHSIAPSSAHVRELLTDGKLKDENEKQESFIKGFIDLQMKFAETAAKVLGIKFEDALLRYTSVYRRLGLSEPLNENHSVWRQFLSMIQAGQTPGKAAYEFFLLHAPKKKISDRCFDYDYDADSKTVHIHFANNDKHEKGPLSDERQEARHAELQSMFADIKKKYPDAERVAGSSWIYNLPNYRRLFPAEYSDSVRRTRYGFSGMSLWGQFINRKGGLREDQVREFFGRLQTAETEEGLQQAFPFSELSAESDIRKFYERYQIR